MRALISLVIILAVAFAVYYGYVKRVQSPGSTVPTQAVSLTGVQNDLLAIAQAERMYFAEHASYASLNELVSSGTLSTTQNGRDGYTYSVDTSANAFVVTARYSGSSDGQYPTLRVDQTMEIRRGE